MASIKTNNAAAITTAIVTIVAVSTALTLLTLTGCGGSATRVVVAKGYKKQFAIDATVAVAVIDQSPQVIYFGNLKKSLGLQGDKTSETALAWRHFDYLMAKHIKQEIDVKDAFRGEPVLDYLVTKEGVRTIDESVIIEVPDIGTHVKFEGGKEASLVLFLDKIRIGTETDPYYQERAQQGFYTGIPRKLVYLTSFLLWDNRERKPICYGRVKTTSPIIREEAAAANWDEVTRELVRKIFEPTGFRKRNDMGKMSD
ncbi:MAG: hypothetical protein LBH93_05205 [Chitinispirillales bacterium]|jgi:hypothetical protein|nr:hypothetical protein [Chitinispirillales bacterium]